MRPVLKSLEQHLYVLSTLALALMIQQVTAIEWSTEPQPFPRVFGIGSGVFDEKFWLPVAACAAAIVGLELLYRRTLVGRAFLAIAEDNFAARALGLPERNLRVASYALAGAIGGLAGFAGGELLLAFVANGAPPELLRLRARRARRARQQPRRRGRRLRPRPVPAGGELPRRRHLLVGRRLRPVHRRPACRAARACSARPPTRRV